MHSAPEYNTRRKSFVAQVLRVQFRFARFRDTSLLAMIGVCCFASVSYSEIRTMEMTPSGDPVPVPAVRLLEIGKSQNENMRSFFGRVSARETVELSFEVSGRMVEFSVLEGTRLAEGDLVAKLDPASFQRIVRHADLNLRQAQRELTRAKSLAARNAGTVAQAEDAETNVELARVALADAKADLEDTVLVAPFDALVSVRIGTEHSNVTAMQPIVSLHDMSEVRVEIEIPERVFLSFPDPHEITFRGTLPNGGTTDLSIAEFETETGAIGQSFRVALRIPEEHEHGLIPGASMTVIAELPVGEVGVPLPPSAILSNSNREFEVMVFVPSNGNNGEVQRRQIELISPLGTSIRALGLADGEYVVAQGAHLLTDGQTVRRYDGLTVEEQ